MLRKWVFRSLSVFTGIAVAWLVAFIAGVVAGFTTGYMRHDYLFPVAIYVLMFSWLAMHAHLALDKSILQKDKADWRLMTMLIGPLAPIGYFWWISDDYERWPNDSAD